MGLLTFAINVTLDGCIDHRGVDGGDVMLRWWTRLMNSSGAMLWGRTTYELMEDYWPQIARDPKADPATRDWAKKLDAKKKYVVSKKRKSFPWENSHHIKGNLTKAVKALKKSTPRRVLLGSHKLATTLHRLNLIDEYLFVIHPAVAGHGPYLFAGMKWSTLKLVSAEKIGPGFMALRYRRR